MSGGPVINIQGGDPVLNVTMSGVKVYSNAGAQAFAIIDSTYKSVIQNVIVSIIVHHSDGYRTDCVQLQDLLVYNNSFTIGTSLGFMNIIGGM